MPHPLTDTIVALDGDQPAVLRVEAVRIVIADEFPIFRDGLRRLLETDRRLQIVGDIGLGPAAVALVHELRPDILLLGPPASGGNWLDTLSALASTGTRARTILLAKAIDPADVVAALQCGAWGVIAKDSAATLLFNSIETVMAGGYWVGQEAAVRDVAASVRRLDFARRCSQRFGLTRRELEIVSAVVNGDTNKEIAGRLSISENTVKRHLMHIFNKVGASSRVELALFAAHHRLLDGS
jgi:two-component system, NarL family, nitrate/nitrite response regulator NarL